MSAPIRVPVDRDLLSDLDWALEKGIANGVTIDVERNPRAKWCLLLRSRRECDELRRQLRFLYGKMQMAGIPFYEEMMAARPSLHELVLREGAAQPDLKYRTNQIPSAPAYPT
jgi:hypothetical protein